MIHDGSVQLYVRGTSEVSYKAESTSEFFHGVVLHVYSRQVTKYCVCSNGPELQAKKGYKSVSNLQIYSVFRPHMLLLKIP